jgi:hypothetical protein
VTSRDFVYWLQGFAEIHGGPPDEKQWEVIKNHINLVFVHEIDPSMPDQDGKLQEAHDGETQFHPANFDVNKILRC